MYRLDRYCVWGPDDGRHIKHSPRIRAHEIYSPKNNTTKNIHRILLNYSIDKEFLNMKRNIKWANTKER